MNNFLRLKLREGRQKSNFLVFGILGFLVTIIVSFMTFSTNQNFDISSDYAQYGFQWKALSTLAAIGSVSLCSPSVKNHKAGYFSDLLSLHGLKKKDQYLGLSLANILTSFQMAGVLILAMALSLFIKKPQTSLINFILAIGVYLLAVGSVAIFTTILSFFISPLALNLLGVLLVFLGALQGVLNIVLGNLGGIFPNTLRTLLKALPPISTFGTLARDLFFGEFSSWNLLFSSVFYIWTLVGILGLIIYGVTKNEG